MCQRSKAGSAAAATVDRRRVLAGLACLSLLATQCSAPASKARPAAAASAVALKTSASASTEVPTLRAPGPQAPVLAVIIVDQMASWVFEQRRASFAANGAFARLLREGVYAPKLCYEHATSSTAPGHAALFTGLPPRDSGVFANEKPDPETNKAVSVFEDGATQVVLDTSLTAVSSSAAILRAETLADALRRQRPDARIITLSLKDRAAIPGGGKHPDAAVWFDPHRAAFVTSSAFHAALPAFARTENRRLPERLRSLWQPLDAAWLQAHAATPDEQAGEGDFGLGIHFPYDLSRSERAGLVFRGYPAADEAVLALARGALDELHPEAEPERPLLLALSLSAFDYVGHVHGPDSWESWEVLRELDLSLAGLLAELERRFAGRLSVMLTADHGTSPLPETAGDTRARPWCAAGAPADPFERPCTKGERLYRDELEVRLKKAANAALGPGDFIRSVVEPFAYFTPAALELPLARRQLLENAAIAALEKQSGVARVFASRSFAAPCPPPSDDSLEALVCRSLPPGAGELYIVTRPGSFFDPNLVRGRGINHGSPYLYDRTVPVLIRASAGSHAGSVLAERIGPADFTATAAALLQITPPPGAASGRDLLR